MFNDFKVTSDSNITEIVTAESHSRAARLFLMNHSRPWQAKTLTIQSMLNGHQVTYHAVYIDHNENLVFSYVN